MTDFSLDHYLSKQLPNNVMAPISKVSNPL